MSKIYLIGLNHKTATVEIREKFALTTFTTPENWLFSRTNNPKNENSSCRYQINGLQCTNCGKFFKNEQGGRCTAKTKWIKKQASQNSEEQELIVSIKDTENTVDLKLPVNESLILSTCNRVEILVCYDHDPNDIIRAWSTACGQNFDDLKPYVYCYEGKEAVLHLFKVASSLDSLVLGEPQILGQLKSAYHLAVKAGQSSIMINKLLHKAFHSAKRVRSETAVASSAVSISYAAVELAKRIFDDISQHEALLIGAGEMAELAAMHLININIAKLRIVNRTFANAEDLANRIGGEAFSFDNLEDCLLKTDIVISSTGAQDTIIKAEIMRSIMKERKNRPMFFIDIAMPRDIDPEVDMLENVYVYDIDDLKEVIEENIAQRKEEAMKAVAIIEDETNIFEIWQKSLSLKPTILDIENKGKNIIDFELEKTIRNLKKLGIETKEIENELEKMANAIVRKCHHSPLHHLQVSYRHNPIDDHIIKVRSIMGLD